MTAKSDKNGTKTRASKQRRSDFHVYGARFQQKMENKKRRKKPMVLTLIRLSHTISENLRPAFQHSLDFYFIFSVSLLAHDNAHPILISVRM